MSKLQEDFKDILPKLAVFTKLNKLVLERDWSNCLDDSIGDLTTLKYLTIHGCSFDYLSSKIGNLVNLVELRLSENYIRELPDTISNLTKLVRLDVSGNKLKELDIESFRKMVSLKSVDVSRNKMYTEDKRHYIDSLKEICTVFENS